MILDLGVGLAVFVDDWRINFGFIELNSTGTDDGWIGNLRHDRNVSMGGKNMQTSL